jgi:hypothetical protein
MNEERLRQAENIKKAKRLNLDVINWYLNTSECTPADMAVFLDDLLHNVSMIATLDDDFLQAEVPGGFELKDSMSVYRLKEWRDLFHKTAIDNGQSLSDSPHLEFYFGNTEAKNYQNL